MNELTRFSAVRVPFRGTSSRANRLTWSQQAMWSCIQWLGEDSHYFNLGIVLPIRADRTQDDVTRALAWLVGRHEVLRTRFAVRDGTWRQEVSAEGHLTLRVFDIDRPAQPGGSTAEDGAEFILAALRSLPFDTGHEWPVRFALVTTEGAPHYLVLVFSHLAVDGTGVDICASELAAFFRDPAGAQADARVASSPWQPADQALREDGPAGERANARAGKHWRAELARAPIPLFPEGGQPAEQPRVWRIGHTSSAAAAGSLMLARKERTSVGTIILAATAAVLGAFTGNSRIALVLTAGNRFDERARSCVAMMAQDTLMTLSLDGATFPEIVERASAASRQAYFAGHYDPALIRQVRAEAARDRGLADIDISAYFNDYPPPEVWARTVPQELTQRQLTALRARSRATTISAWPRQDSTLFIHSRYRREVSILHAVTDTALFPLARARAMLRAIEQLIVLAAFETVGPADITAIVRAEDDRGQSAPG